MSDFERWMNSNADDIFEVIESDDYVYNEEDLNKEIDNFTDSIRDFFNKEGLKFSFDKSQFVNVKEQKLLLSREGTSFDLFLDLDEVIKSKDKLEAKRIYDTIVLLSNQKDTEAQVAYAMCIMLGYFNHKNETDAWERINFLGENCNSMSAIVLVTQYNYLVLYKQKGILSGLKAARIGVKLALDMGSNMAKLFFEKYKQDLIKGE